VNDGQAWLDRSDYRLAIAKKFGADCTIDVTGLSPSEVIDRVRDLTEGVAPISRSNARGSRRRSPGNRDGAQGGMYIVAGVFADVGTVTLNPHHIAARQVRLIGMCNHPSTGYMASLKLLDKFQHTFR